MEKGFRRDWGGTPIPQTLLHRIPRRMGPQLSEELLATIQQQLLPPLVIAHAHARGRSGDDRDDFPSDARLPPTEDEVALLADMAVEQDLLRALGLVATMLGRGLSMESLLLLLIAPAARLLCQEWMAERRPFTDVMAGLDVIQKLATRLRTAGAPT
jgi:MerR family transcriptional regulator, light-induced transcriptional regulator